jgi:hypothetical protein
LFHAYRQPGIALLLLALCCGSALAHGAASEQKSLWVGALHVISSPLSIAAAVALVLSVPGLQDPRPVLVAVLAALGAATASLALPFLALPYWSPHLVLILLGGVAAAGLRLAPQRVLWPSVLAVCGGWAAGQAAELDVPSWAGAAGAGLSLGLPVFLGLMAWDDLEKIDKVRSVLLLARRILGAWIIAIGVLMGALALKMHA